MTDAPDLPGRPRRTGLHLLDMVVSICALFMSGVSIYMANQNSASMEDLVHANSWPFLQIDSGNTSNGGDHTLDFGLSNAGVGPARIYSAIFLVNGQPVENMNLLVNISERCCASEYRETSPRARGAILTTASVM